MSNGKYIQLRQGLQPRPNESELDYYDRVNESIQKDKRLNVDEKFTMMMIASMVYRGLDVTEDSLQQFMKELAPMMERTWALKNGAKPENLDDLETVDILDYINKRNKRH